MILSALVIKQYNFEKCSRLYGHPVLFFGLCCHFKYKWYNRKKAKHEKANAVKLSLLQCPSILQKSSLSRFDNGTNKRPRRRYRFNGIQQNVILLS